MSCPENVAWVRNEDLSLVALVSALITSRGDALSSPTVEHDKHYARVSVGLAHLIQESYGVAPLMLALGREAAEALKLLDGELKFSDAVLFQEEGVWTWRYIGDVDDEGAVGQFRKALRLIVQATTFSEVLHLHPSEAPAEDRALVTAWINEVCSVEYPCSLAGQMAAIVAGLHGHLYQRIAHASELSKAAQDAMDEGGQP